MIGGVVALAVTAAAGPLARRLGERTGALDHPSGVLKPHPRPVSYLGGVAVAVGVLAGFGVEGWPFPWALPVAVFGLALVGLADDVAGLPPLLRLALQVALGALLATQGLRAAPVENDALAWLFTVGLFTGAVNAANMIDGMDGLAASTTAISALGLAVVAAMGDRSAALALVLAGAALGFLLHNAPPARLFLGNSGSYLAGGTLAVTILLLSRSPALFVGAGTCLGLIALDFLVVVLGRIVRRQALFEAYRHHTYDQLLARGLSVRATLALSAAVHGVLVAVGVLAASLPNAAAVAVVAAAWSVTLVVMGVVGFITGRAGMPQDERPPA